jgi:hypothetical protein
MDSTTWTPERKVVGAAVAVIIVNLITQFTGFDPQPGIEGAIAVLVAYLLPNSDAE